MKSSLFTKGFKEVRKESERREKLREAKKGKIWRFSIKENEEDVPVRFLTEEPINYYEHSIKQGGSWVNIPCTQDSSCSCCNGGDKPRYVSAWLIVDGREFEVEERNSKGEKTGKKKKVKDRIKILTRGVTVAGQLDSLNRKHGLLDRVWYITRIGKDSQSVWNFDRGDEDELTDKQMKALFSQLAEEYQDLEPMEILIKQLEMGMEVENLNNNSSGNDDDEDDDDDESDKEALKSKVQKIDDDDEEEEEVKKKVVKKHKPLTKRKK